MRISQISPSDIDGGSERTALDLHTQFIDRGLDANLLVGRKVKTPAAVGVYEIPRSKAEEQRLRLVKTLLGTPKNAHRAKIIEGIATPSRIRCWRDRHDDFSYNTLTAFQSSGALDSDVLQYHSLYGHYLNVGEVVELSHLIPTFVKVHDDWVFTGKCTSHLGCQKYHEGCQQCPRWPRYHASIRQNYVRKEELWDKALFHVVTPSEWMRDQLEGTIFQPAIISSRVIPNGVDVDVFKPSDKLGIRTELGIPSDALIILCGAASAKSSIKNLAYIAKAIRSVANTSQYLENRLHVMVLGGDPVDFDVGAIPVTAIPFIDDPQRLAHIIQATDVYVHASKAESFGRALVEAQACGVPVIATDVGGVGETLVDGKTGFLVPQDDLAAIVQALLVILTDDTKRHEMAMHAREHVVENLSDTLMADRYLDYYEEILCASS